MPLLGEPSPTPLPGEPTPTPLLGGDQVALTRKVKALPRSGGVPAGRGGFLRADELNP